MSEMVSQGISTRELLSFGYKYKRRLILAFVIPFLVAFFVSFLPTPRYEATSVLVVRLGSEYVYQPEIGNSQSGQSVNIPFEREQIFKSEVAILSSDDLHAQTIKAIGVDKLYPELVRTSALAFIMAPIRLVLDSFREMFGQARPQTDEQINAGRLALATSIFGQRFGIMLEKESAVIDVSFEHTDPAMATLALEQLLKFYFEKRKQLYLESRVSLAEAQVKSSHERIVNAEQAVEEFKRKNQIYSFADQRDSLLQQRTEVEQQMGTLNSRQAELKSLLSNLNNRGSSHQKEIVLYDRGGGDAAMANARIRLIDAESHLKDTLAHYTKDSSVVIAAQKQLRDAREVLSQSELDRTRAESELGSNDIRHQSLEKSIATYNQQLDQLDALERDYNALVREAKLAEDDYTLYVHQLDEAKARDKLQHDREGSVRIIQAPSTSPNAKKLQPMIIAAGIFLALICMVFVAALTEFFRSGFYTPERLERSLGLPVLATIPLQE